MLDVFFLIEIPFIFFVILGFIIYLFAKKDVLYGIVFLFLYDMIIKETFLIKIFSQILGKKIWIEFLFIFVFILISFINKKKIVVSNKINLVNVLFILFILFSFINGLLKYKLAAVYDSTVVTLPIAFILYFLSFYYDKQNLLKIFNTLFKISTILMLVALIKYSLLFGNVFGTIIKYIDFRVTDRNGIMLWVFVLTYKLIEITSVRKQYIFRDYAMILLLLLFILFSTLRQAWVVMFIIFPLVVLLTPRKIMNLKLLFLPLIGLLVTILLISVSPKFSNSVDIVFDSFRETVIPTNSGLQISENSTYAFREKVTEKYIENITPISLFVGKGFGDRPYITLIEGQDSVGVHNQYVYFLYYIGLIGLVCFILIHFQLILKINSLRKSLSTGESKIIATTTLIGLLYYLPANYSNTMDYVFPLIISLSFIQLRLFSERKVTYSGMT